MTKIFENKIAKRLTWILSDGLNRDSKNALRQLDELWQEISNDAEPLEIRQMLHARVIETKIDLFLGAREFGFPLWDSIRQYLEMDGADDARKLQILGSTVVTAARKLKQ